MNKPTGITGVHQTSNGSPQPIAKHRKGPGPLATCVKKWAPYQPQVKGLPWSQCPPEMLEDFARAGANELREIFGAGAAEKGLEVLAIALANVLPLTLSVAWSGSSARIDLTLRAEADAAADLPVAPGVVFDLDAPADADEAALREGLVAAAERSDDRLTFHPTAAVRGRDLLPLARSLEAALDRPGQPADDMDVLMSIGGVLVLWERLESMNVKHYNARLGGLTVDDADVLPGQCVVVEGTVTGVDPVPASPSDEPRQKASIRWKPC